MCDFEDKCLELEDENHELNERIKWLEDLIDDPRDKVQLLRERKNAQKIASHARLLSDCEIKRSKLLQDNLKETQAKLDSDVRGKLSGLVFIFRDNVELMKERDWCTDTIDHVLQYHDDFWKGKI